ncbi:MAG TPA: exodeoxyribonuclease VII large subunit, partial [bacterium]|nr:exodeoxyribonuclease VII large subunit [bacterium]
MVDPEPLAAALSVSELTERLRLQLEERFGWVQVRGEISNYKKAPSG